MIEFITKMIPLICVRLFLHSIPTSSFLILSSPNLCNNKAISMRIVSSEDDVLLSIRHFRELHGHTNVPQNFVISDNISSIWPSSLIGLKLGHRVNAIRKSFKNGLLNESIISKLNELDFSWHVYDSKFEYICKLLPIYLQLHSNLEMPYSYIINASESSLWPVSANGFNLGHRVHAIRNGKMFTSEEHRKEFQDLKLLEYLKIKITDKPRYKRPIKSTNCNVKNISTIDIDKISLFEILHSFYQIYHNFRIPITFVVSADDTQWSSKYWNQPIGLLLQKLRRNKIAENAAKNSNSKNDENLKYLELQNLLKVNSIKAFQFQVDYYLLVTYLNYHPSLTQLLLTPSYIIPHDNSLWPVFSFDRNLTQQFRDIQSSLHYYHHTEYRVQLEQLPGFQWTLPEKEIALQLLKTSLHQFQLVHGMNSFPSVHYVIPHPVQSQDRRSTSSTGGFPLGNHILKIAVSKSRSNIVKQQKDLVFSYVDTILNGNIQEKKDEKNLEHVMLLASNENITIIDKNNNQLLQETSTFSNNEVANISYLTQLHGHLKNKPPLSLTEPPPVDTDISKKQGGASVKTIEKFRRIVLALLIHYDLFGDYLVPRYFIVPEESPWPKETWGMHLGNRVRNIRHGRAYNKSKYHNKLNDIGFLMDLDGYRIKTNFNKNYYY